MVRRALRTRDTTAFRAAREAGLPDNAIRHLLDGRDSRISRLVEICNALGLEFYVGRPRLAASSVSLLKIGGVPASARGDRSASRGRTQPRRSPVYDDAETDWLEPMIEPLRQEYRALDRHGRALMLIRLVAALLDFETPATDRRPTPG